MSQLIPFQFEMHTVRTLTCDDGALWWVATDICSILELSNVSDAVGRLLSDEKSDLSSLGFSDTALIINEKGLYRLIFRSNKPEAKRFQNWVFGEVLPQIRQTGSYSAPSASQLPALPSADTQLSTIEKALNILDRLSQLTPRDALMYADMTRNVSLGSQRLLGHPSVGAPAHGFSVADRCATLGYHLTRKQGAIFLPVLGKLLAKEYRSRYGCDPQKEARYVDGATRPVSWFAEGDGEWIDAIIQGYLAGFPGLGPAPSVSGLP